jgi:hypothetical protein
VPAWFVEIRGLGPGYEPCGECASFDGDYYLELFSGSNCWWRCPLETPVCGCHYLLLDAYYLNSPYRVQFDLYGVAADGTSSVMWFGTDAYYRLGPYESTLDCAGIGRTQCGVNQNRMCAGGTVYITPDV